jgi:hypothetical protein
MPLLTEALEEALCSIEKTLARIEQAEDVEAGLNDVQSHILSVLWLVERNPGIEAAADDLYRAAAACVKDKASVGSRHRRIMNDASARFRERLKMASPSEQARRLGLT